MLSRPFARTLIVLLLLLLPALLLDLGVRPVYKIQEVRIAETAREMLTSGDWVIPRYNGELRLQKPPLPYWLTAAAYAGLGVNAWATRLPAVIFGLFSALFLWQWTRRYLRPDAAANSVLVLVFSYIGLRYFRSGEADAILLFFISAACGLGYDILHGRGDARRRLLFGAALGLGFLSKGPAALAIPLLTLGLALWVEKRAGRAAASPRDFFSGTGLAALLVLAFGWYVWVLWRYPEAAQHFFGKQVDETFVSGTHAKPIGWYLENWLGFFAPWGILLLPAAWLNYRQRGAALPALVRFAWIWLGVVFVLLTVTVNKQMQYALLFAPPQAILIGYYLSVAQGGFVRCNRVLFGLFCLAALLGAVYVAVKLAGGSALLLYLAPFALACLVKRVLGEDQLAWPVLCVAVGTSVAFLYSEAHLSKEPRKLAVQTVMQAASGHAPLYQSQRDGAISFYAGQVVPPVKDEDLADLLQKAPEIWLVGKTPPLLAGVEVTVVAEAEGLSLYRLRRRP